ncbi:MAG: DUF1851 domain-containing protein [Eubacterium sp.]|nr:DUF1851 domain-containing protein [Eubacterium sp.]
MLINFKKFFGINNDIVLSADLYSDVVNQLGGSVLNSGLFTVFKENDISRWNNIVKETYTEFPSEVKLFGYDWLGRCFGMDSRNETFGNVLMYEIGTADILEIPCNLESFLDEEIPIYSDDCLAESFFKEWLDYSKQKISYGQCVGYKVPLFLNGDDSVENLELNDMEVYWGVIGQIKNLI